MKRIGKLTPRNLKLASLFLALAGALFLGGCSTPDDSTDTPDHSQHQHHH